MSNCFAEGEPAEGKHAFRRFFFLLSHTALSAPSVRMARTSEE